jgi:hypothetical protein
MLLVLLEPTGTITALVVLVPQRGAGGGEEGGADGGEGAGGGGGGGGGDRRRVNGIRFISNDKQQTKSSRKNNTAL